MAYVVAAMIKVSCTSWVMLREIVIKEKNNDAYIETDHPYHLYYCPDAMGFTG
jgi:hypothetical protein